MRARVDDRRGLGRRHPLLRWTFGLALSLVLVSCGDSGPDATAPGDIESICGSNFCIDYPSSWQVAEDGGTFVSFVNPADEERLLATVSQVNMEGVVTQAGNPWPQPPDGVVRSFWQLLEESGATLATLDPRRDGSVGSLGSYDDGRLWILIAPIDSTTAVGVEVRAPNSTWSTHVDVFFDSLVIAVP